MQSTSRRDFLKAAGAGTTAALLPMPAVAQGNAGRVVVIGGGFAGWKAAGGAVETTPARD